MHGTESRPVDVYLQVKPIPPDCWPAWVVREDGATLVTVDPSSTRAEVAMWSPDHLTVDEMNAYRWAYRQPLVGMPLEEWWLEDECFPLDVPSCLQLLPAKELMMKRSRNAREQAAAALLHARLLQMQGRSTA